MKKVILTLIIILGMALAAAAQGGLFQYGAVSDEDYYGAGNRDGETPLISLPSTHGDATDSPAPLGSGALLLIGFGVAYALKKNRRSN